MFRANKGNILRPTIDGPSNLSEQQNFRFFVLVNCRFSMQYLSNTIYIFPNFGAKYILIMFHQGRKPRVDPQIAAEAIEKIGALKGIFHDEPPPKDFGKDETKGIILLSRFKSDPVENIADDPIFEKNGRSKDNEEAEDNSVTSTELTDATTSGMSHQNRLKRRRLAMSFATLAAKPWKREKIVKEGAIPALIDLSALNDAQMQRSCALAFAYLCKEPSIRAQIIREGAFAALVAMTQSHSRKVKADCCRAICNLCMENGFEFNAVRDGVTFAVVQVATSHPETIDVCLKVLLNLSHVAYPRLEEMTDALLHFNSLNLNESQLMILMQTMCNLSATKNNQLRLIEDGCLVIVENSIKSSSPALRLLAADTVRNLTTDQRSKNKLVDHNVIATLVAMSKDEMELVKKACVFAFYNLSKDITCREKIVHGHAVAVIIKMSMEKFQNVEMGRTAARTLRVLCGDRNVAHLLIRDGIVKALMSLISKDEGMIKDDGVIRQYCAESICSLFQIGDVLGRLIDQGAVGVLVSLSLKNIDLITGEWCSFALFHLATNPVCPKLMYSRGILPCLIKLCKHSSSRSKYFCTAALAHITSIKDVNSADAIPILVDMLKQESNPVTQKSCSIALCNLTDTDANSCLVLESGALPAVVRLTNSNDIQTKMKCAAIISKLSLFQQYYYQFSEDNVLKVLLDLSCVDHTLTQRRVILALSNLTQSQDLRKQLLELRPIKYIISLATKPDENLRRGCVSIVCNLSYEAGSETQIVKAGVMPTLLITALVTSDKIQSKIICAKALVNLMADPTLHAVMVKEGVIWGMATLALLENTELLKLCINAICTLSGEFARDILKLSTAVKTVMFAINHTEDVEITLAGGRTLMNLLLNTTDKDESFRKFAVENMTNLVQCKDEEVCEISILCLCVASQSESCRSVIVSSGMLHMIDVSTIFSQHRVSFAYLTMFGNIANNPSMRTELLDNQCLSRFSHICMSADPSLDMAVVRALYCLSCASENLTKLVDQTVLELLRIVYNNLSKYPSEVQSGSDVGSISPPSTGRGRSKTNGGGGNVKSEIILYIIATIYNVSTSRDCHARLVSQDVVALLSSIWPSMKSDYNGCILIVGTMLHLACGNVNSSKMIEQGCCDIICFVTQHSNDPLYAGYYFEHEMHEMCAAGLRNLLIVVKNQEALVEAGAIESLCSMATMSGATTASAVARKSNKAVSIRDNCAAALRSMTYNNKLRSKLLATGAIKVLMSSMTSGSSHKEGVDVTNEDDFYVGHTLLCELEAESWENGSRGKGKEGRAPIMESRPIFVDFLQGSSNVDLEVQHRSAELPKYTVQVHLEELPAEENTDTLQLELGIDDLASFEDNEDMSMPTADLHPKMECDVQTAPPPTLGDVASHITGKGVISVEEDVDDNLYDTDNHVTINPVVSPSGEAPPGAHFSAAPTPISNPSDPSVNANGIVSLTRSASSMQLHGKTHVGFAESEIGNRDLPFPPIHNNNNTSAGIVSSNQPMQKSLSYSNSQIGATNNEFDNLHATSLPHINATNNSASIKPVRKAPNERKKIKALVAVIKQAKDGKGDIDDVLKKWGTLSKF